MKTAIDLGGLFGYDCSDLLGKDWRVRTSGWFRPYPDLIMFGGGEDIHPIIYNNEPVPWIQYRGHPSARFMIENEFFIHAIREGIPMLGICRGAQLLCALSGGHLVQDVHGHGDTHPITDIDGETCHMPSTHHQMMYPGKAKHTLVAWAQNMGKDRSHTIEGYVDQKFDPEIVFFPNTGALCIQGHPEYFGPESSARKMTNKWVFDCLGVEL